MKYVLIVRKLVIDDTIYYQVIDEFEEKLLDDDQVNVEASINYKEENLNYLGKSYANLFFLELNKEQYEAYKINSNMFLKIENDVLRDITNFAELNMVAEKFYNLYKDFMLIPNYNLSEIIADTKNKLQSKLLGQDDAINKVLNKIYSNHMYFNSDIELDRKYKNKNNILIISPRGTGKTTMKEVLLDNLYPIPTIEMRLTGNINTDISNMTNKLLNASDKNLYMAMSGIVVFDGIDSLSTINKEETQSVNVYINELKEIMSKRLITFKDKDNQIYNFDASLLTYMLFIDMNYYERIENNMIYSNISSDELELLGIVPMLDDYFNSEIIFMNSMTRDLALKILKDKNLSPLIELKNIYESKGYKVRFERQFVEQLIEYGLDNGDGMTGIIQLLKIVLQSKDINKNNLIFRATDFDKLKIGTCIYDDDSDEYNENYENTMISIEDKSEKNRNNSLSLKVNLNKRTINGLTVMDAVNKIKENIRGQDEQIFTLVNAFYNHIFNKNKKISYYERKELKENVLLIGGTGVGKTSMLENLAKIFNIPYQRELATRYSASGYVGEDVDTMLVDLIKTANGDVNKAENGILYIDEIDKINIMPDDNIKMGGAVQNQLLTIIEGSKRSINRHTNTYNFDTTDLFVSATGVFEDLDKIVKQRIKKESGNAVIGFNSETEKMIDKDIKPEDIVKCGFDRQFVGRFPIIIKLNDLNENILLDIINNSKNGYVNLCKKSYSQSNITIEMSDDFKRKLAKKAMEQKSGARGIKTVFSKIRKEIDRNIQGGDIEKVILDEDSVENPKQITYVKRK